MNTLLRVSALFVAILTIALWFFGGFNLGQTRLVVPVEHPGDDGRPIVIPESRFLPGIDFLSAGLAISAALLAGAWLRRPDRLTGCRP